MGAVGATVASVAVPLATAGLQAGLQSDSGSSSMYSITEDPMSRYRTKGLRTIMPILQSALEDPEGTLAKYTDLSIDETGYAPLTGISQAAINQMNQIMSGGLLTDLDVLSNQVAVSQLLSGASDYYLPTATNAIRQGLVGGTTAQNLSELSNWLGSGGSKNLMGGSIGDALASAVNKQNLYTNDLLAKQGIQDLADWFTAQQTADQVKMSAANTLQSGAGASGLMNLINSWSSLASVPRTQEYAERMAPYELQQQLLEAYQGALNLSPTGTTTTSSTSSNTDFGTLFAANALPALGNLASTLVSNWVPSVSV